MRKNCEEAVFSKFWMKRTAKAVWDTLKSLYEGNTVIDYGTLLCSISKLTYNDRESTIEAHISEYERRWNYFSSILATSELSKYDDGFGVALQQLTRSDQAKPEFLLQTIPPFYSNTVENIRSKEGYHYGDVARKLILYIPARQKGKASKAVAGSANNPIVLATNTKNRDNGKTCRYCKEKDGLEKAMKNLNASQKREKQKKQRRLKPNMKMGKLKMNILQLSKSEMSEIAS
jgi:hypothetical protein